MVLTISSIVEDIDIFQAIAPLFLASASPRRISFMQSLGLSVSSIAPPESAEPSPLPGELPQLYAIRAAYAKAYSILPAILKEPPALSANGFVIAADTIVVDGDKIFGKPVDTIQAFEMLKSLSGKKHTVITGCVVLPFDRVTLPPPPYYGPGTDALSAPEVSPHPNDRHDRHISFAVESTVFMWECPEAALRAYAESGEPLDKAGAYAVQGTGAFLVESVEGSWSNVVGLPLAELIRTLLDIQAISPQCPALAPSLR